MKTESLCLSFISFQSANENDVGNDADAERAEDADVGILNTNLKSWLS